MMDKSDQKRDIKKAHTKKIEEPFCMLTIALVSIGMILCGKLLMWMKVVSILLIGCFLYGLISKKIKVFYVGIMVFVLCNLIIIGKYNGKWFWETSNTLSAKTGIYGSQITYKYGDWADAILPVFVEEKTVYINTDNIYNDFFKCYALDVKPLDYSQVSWNGADKYLHMGPVYFQGYSYLFTEEELDYMDELFEKMGHYPQLFLENAELSNETEVVCVIGNDNNIYIMSKEEYVRIINL